MNTSQPTGLDSPAAPDKPRDEDLDFFGVTHKGHVRAQNEDQFLFCTLHKTLRVGGTSLPNPELLEMPSQRIASFGMVADGVGGRAGGEVASRAAVEAVAGYVTHAMECFYVSDANNETAFCETLGRAARRGHEAVLAQAEKTGMATTLTMMLAVWPHLYLLHVGDSRCYRYRAGHLELLTRDQTMAQDMVDSGMLPADRAADSRFAHILSSSLGGRTSEPAVTTADLKPGDMYLLCTDGLTKHVSEAKIAERLANLTTSEQGARQLVEDALADGGTDNVTVVVFRNSRRSPGA